MPLNKLGFNSRACMEAIKQIADAEISKASEIMLEIFAHYVTELGNGSGIMKMAALACIRETLHEVTDTYLKVKGGVDEDMAKAASEEVYVRVMVVLHGNMHSGPMQTKPGVATFPKHVGARRMSPAKEVVPLPFFEQPADVAEQIKESAMRDMEKHIRAMLRNIAAATSGDFFAGFVTAG